MFIETNKNHTNTPQSLPSALRSGWMPKMWVVSSSLEKTLHSPGLMQVLPANRYQVLEVERRGTFCKLHIPGRRLSRWAYAYRPNELSQCFCWTRGRLCWDKVVTIFLMGSLPWKFFAFSRCLAFKEIGGLGWPTLAMREPGFGNTQFRLVFLRLKRENDMGDSLVEYFD